MEDSAAQDFFNNVDEFKVNESCDSCKCKEQMDFQLKLIDSLKARIEELETDYIIKKQDIKEIQQETSNLRENIQSNCYSISKLQQETSDLRRINCYNINKSSDSESFGKILFNSGLNFWDVTKHLKSLDDEKLIEKILRGYVGALKNDVQGEQRRAREAELKSLFPKKTEDANQCLDIIDLTQNDNNWNDNLNNWSNNKSDNKSDNKKKKYKSNQKKRSLEDSMLDMELNESSSKHRKK